MTHCQRITAALVNGPVWLIALALLLLLIFNLLRTISEAWHP